MLMNRSAIPGCSPSYRLVGFRKGNTTFRHSRDGQPLFIPEDGRGRLDSRLARG